MCVCNAAINGDPPNIHLTTTYWATVSRHSGDSIPDTSRNCGARYPVSTAYVRCTTQDTCVCLFMPEAPHQGGGSVCERAGDSDSRSRNG